MKKFTIFALIGIMSTAFSLNAMRITFEDAMCKKAITIEEEGIFSSEVKVSPELYTLLQSTEPQQSNKNNTFSIQDPKKQKQELIEYKDILEKRRASLPHRLERFF